MNIRQRRVWATFLLVNILQSTFLPGLAHALTSGPTTPETSNFEPVDTTDMVNLATGGMTYNLPLLEVPGPEGGYPINLAYHAGIKPGQDASWVGLGWTINPGAIGRVVNGWPDDHNAIIKTVKDYWAGGNTKSYSVGVSVGVPGSPANLGLGVTVSKDTYQGFGGGFGLSFGSGALSISLSTDLTTGSSGIGVGYGPAQLNYNMESGFSGSVNITQAAMLAAHMAGGGEFSSFYNAPSQQASFKGLPNQSSMGISFDSKGLKPTTTVAGISLAASNSNFGRISTSLQSYAIMIPIPYTTAWLNLGYNYRRYWMQENDYTRTFGSLYPSEAYTFNSGWTPPSDASLSNYNGPQNRSLDSYSIQEFDQGHSAGNDPDLQLGGSFPAYDAYMVSAQGLGGTMQPYMFQNASLFRQVKAMKDAQGNVTEVKANFGRNNAFNKKVNFRFNNDFSNTTSFPLGDLAFLNTFTPNFQGTSISATAPSGYPSGLDNSGSEIHLAGSKHIEWYTNNQIKTAFTNNTINTLNGLVLTQDMIADRGGSDIADQVGGFAITNEQGVTYHYTLPVYAHNEFVKSYKTDTNGNDESYNLQRNNKAYAYTWLLTAITGPDFVDRGSNGTSSVPDGYANDGDYGYWVTFHYGRWAGHYQWRNPDEGFYTDISGQKYYSIGKKELYYLDAIKTRTHTALFVKSIRNDAKGVNNRVDGGWASSGYEDILQTCNLILAGQPVGYYYDFYRITGMLPTSTMKLEKILLVKNNELNAVHSTLDVLRTNGTETNSQTYPLSFSNIPIEFDDDCASAQKKFNTGNQAICDCPPNGTANVKLHDEEDVVDITDISPSLDQYCFKRIEFNYDYSLCPETPNSFSNGFYSGGAWPTTRDGKLSLKSVNFVGQSSKVTFPPINFQYDPFEGTNNGNTTTTTVSSQTVVNLPMSAAVGDIVQFTQNSNINTPGNIYYVLLTQVNGSGFNFKILGNNTPPTATTFYNTRFTKNPPYKRDHFDWWGNYMCDFSGNQNSQINDLKRKPTATTAKQVDAWSLRTIETSLGAKINVTYAAKDFDTDVVQNDRKMFHINSVSGPPSYVVGNSAVSITIGVSDPISYTAEMPVGQSLRVVVPARLEIPPSRAVSVMYDFTATVTAVSGSNFTISIPQSSTIPFTQFTCNLVGGNMPNPGETTNVIWEGAGYIVKDDVTGDDGIGDGVRVSSIKVVSASGDSKETLYNYQNGTTSYQPNYTSLSGSSFSSNTSCAISEAIKRYLEAQRKSYLAISREIPSPGVMYGKVVVTEKANNLSLPGSKEYNFKTFDWGMVGYAVTNQTTAGSGTIASPRLLAREVTISNKTALVGALLSQKTYSGLGQLVNSVTNNYVDPNSNDNTEYDTYNRQGIVEQVFNEIRYNYTSSALTRYAVKSKKIDYPAVVKSVDSYQNGVTATAYNRAFDFFTGEPIVLETASPTGEKFRSVSVPAYRVSALYQNGGTTPNVGMGLKVTNIKNKHMLTQNAARYSFEVNNWWDGTLANPETQNVSSVLNASVSTWSRDWPYRDYNPANDNYPLGANDGLNLIWRKNKEWVFKSSSNPDGSYAVSLPGWLTKASGSALINFDPGNETGNITNGWRKINEVKYYNRFSSALEEEDINGNTSATKMGYNNSLAIATASPCKYVEMAFSSAEDPFSPEANVNYFGGEIFAPSSTYISTVQAHTGRYSVILNGTNNYGYTYRANVGTGQDQIARKKYLASAWVYAGSAENDRNYLYCNVYNGNTSIQWTAAKINDANAQVVGPWIQVRLPIDLTSLSTATRIEIGTWSSGQTTNAYLDDFRFKPMDAIMSSYVYDPVTYQLTYVLDNDNMYTQYVYDKAGRLVEVLKETPDNPTGKRLISRTITHFKRSQ